MLTVSGQYLKWDQPTRHTWWAVGYNQISGEACYGRYLITRSVSHSRLKVLGLDVNTKTSNWLWQHFPVHPTLNPTNLILCILLHPLLLACLGKSIKGQKKAPRYKLGGFSCNGAGAMVSSALYSQRYLPSGKRAKVDTLLWNFFLHQIQ